MTSCSIHTLVNDNIHADFIEYHKKVFEYFDVPVNYYFENTHPGKFYNKVMEQTDSDIIFFCDIDAIILNESVIENFIKWTLNDYMIGIGQVTGNCNSIYDFYCGPAFMSISKKYYEDIGSPSFMDDCSLGCDVGQQVTYAAQKNKKRIKILLPETFQTTFRGGLKRYSFYGYNGVGSIYENSIYHLFQGRFEVNRKLFVETCEHVLSGDISKIKRPYNCKDEFIGKFNILEDYK